MGMAEDVVSELHSRIAKTLDDLRRDLAKVRTGRANPQLLDSVRVDYYGTPTPLNQVANVTVADPRLIELLSGPITDDALIQEALELLRHSSGLERARVTLSDYARRARAELAALPASPARDACESVADYLVARTH